MTDIGGTQTSQSSPTQDNAESVGVGGIASARLKSFVERIERLEEEKQGIADDIKDVKAEAKSAGFDPAALNEVLKLRKMDAADRAQREEIIGLYKHALDMV